MTTILYYIHDPMCSWCYAFQPVFNRLQRQLPKSVNVEKVVGGLAPDNQTPMPYPLQLTIQNTWRRIEQTVPGIKFNFDFWSNNTPKRSTYLACRAVLAAQRQGTQQQDKMIAAIQKAYYQQAQNPSLLSVLTSSALDCGLNINQFTEDLNDASVQRQFTEHLELSNSLGVSSFPSLRLSKDGQISELKIDYLEPQIMLTQVIDILSA